DLERSFESVLRLLRASANRSKTASIRIGLGLRDRAGFQIRVANLRHRGHLHVVESREAYVTNQVRLQLLEIAEGLGRSLVRRFPLVDRLQICQKFRSVSHAIA